MDASPSHFGFLFAGSHLSLSVSIQLYLWDNVLIYTHSKDAGRSAYTFCALYQFVFGYTLIIQVRYILPNVVFLRIFWNIVNMLFPVWSGSMHDSHIALQKLQARALTLLRMALHLFSKVVALHLDNSTVKA